ncbi:MAG: thioredoxin domain-containing protein [Elusimicrobia bacterium]|nr:thioredoxin domain-containing protein [Candidatus Obscuribacterium magneticum]
MKTRNRFHYFLAMIIAFQFVWLFNGPTYAVDKVALARHVRSAYNIDLEANIAVEDPVPSELPGLQKVPVDIGGRKYSVYVSPDERFYIMGQVFDLGEYPDATRAAKISLEKVHAKGSPKAPLTLVEFTDFQCPYCRVGHENLTQMLYTTYNKDQIRWVFKQFPLENHEWSQAAAIATECAAKQKEDAFWEMADLFYKNQKDIKKDNIDQKIDQFVLDLKLNPVKFKACQASDDVKKKIEADKAEGQALGVSATPTLVVNGRMKTGFRDFNSLKLLIDDKLKEVK